MDSDINILITSVGRRTYLVEWFREALQGHGRVYAANSTALTPAFGAADGTLVTPPILSKHYIPTLLRFCRKEKITAIFSLYDADLPVLAAAAERFAAQGTRVITAPAQTLKICEDKLAMFRYLRGHGVPVPVTYTVEALRLRYQRWMMRRLELSERRGRTMAGDSCGKSCSGTGPEGFMALPLMVKPRYGMGSIGVEEARDLQGLAAAMERTEERIAASYLAGFQKTDDILIQEKVSGREFHLDIICDLEGHYCTTIAKEKLAMRSGETDAARIVDPESEEGRTLCRLGKKLALLLPHPADLDADVILVQGGSREDRAADHRPSSAPGRTAGKNGSLDDNSEENWQIGTVIRHVVIPYVLDLNCRFGGGYPFAHMAGANLPLAILKWLTGEPVPAYLLRAEPGTVSMKSPMPTLVATPQSSLCTRRLLDPILFQLEGEKEIRQAVQDFGRYLDPPLQGRREFNLDIFAHKMAVQGIALAAADQNGNMAGILCMYANALGGDDAWGTFLAVRPCVRGQGIGTRLFRAALRQASFAGKRRLCFLVHRANRSAIRFYQTMGCRTNPPADSLRQPSSSAGLMLEMYHDIV